MIVTSLLQAYDETGYNDVNTTCVTDANGNKHWYLNDKLHRDDGPAIENANGNKFWYQNGKRHRVDGPAIETANGNKQWYLNGKPVVFSSINQNGQLIKTTQRKEL